jgi:hypothetical protein
MAPTNWALVRQGDKGARVSAVQFLLRARGSGIAADGDFGPLTAEAVRQFQSQNGLGADGIVGNQTWPALIIQVAQGSTGEAVKAVQVLLPPLAVDGIFGPQTDHKVRGAQSRSGMGAGSGIVDTETWMVLTSLVAVAPAQALIEPDSIANLGMGTTKSEAHAVFGAPTSDGKQFDVHGNQYDFLHWQLDGNRGLPLNYRFPEGVSPKLTDWHANARGPVTKKGVRIDDSAGQVTAAYGPLEPFVGAQIVRVNQGGGQMIVIVDGGSVRSIIGGDQEFWMRSIAT